jgi:hypothetical protein
MSVGTKPGHTAFAVMPDVPTSLATAFIRPMMACLLVM